MSQLSDVFEQVKQDIINGRDIYICIILDKYKLREEHNFLIDKAKNIIEERLDGAYSYESWVKAHHPEVYERWSPEWLALRKQSRINWLDSLIEEFK